MKAETTGCIDSLESIVIGSSFLDQQEYVPLQNVNFSNIAGIIIWDGYKIYACYALKKIFVPAEKHF